MEASSGHGYRTGCAPGVFKFNGMPLARIALVSVLVAASLAGVFASAAGAAEVRLDRLGFGKYGGPPPGYFEELVVRAGPGEPNRLTVARGAAGELRVTDVGASLLAGPGCTAVGAQQVDCATTSPVLTAFVFAGDGDDTVSSSVAVSVDGGSGDDRLVGSTAADVLYGGKGRDVLRGDDGDDALQDGRLVTFDAPDWPGEGLGSHLRSRIAPVRAERDVFDGGAGVDTLGYRGRRRGIVVDLSRGDRPAGAPGEGDLLQGLEGVDGTDGDDRLLGDDAANSLGGHAGDDLLVGRGGDDELRGHLGSNRLRGDAGDDLIGVETAFPFRRLGRQRVSCGPGRDQVSTPLSQDFVEDDCETLFIGEVYEVHSLLPPTTWRRPPLASFNRCVEISCRIRLEVRLARSPDRRLPRLKGLLLGRASATIPWGTGVAVTVSLSDRGSRLLRRYRNLLIRIQLNASTVPGQTASPSYLTRLRAPES
jgi:Ca2+-binding RTX toxin-like protein